MAAKGLVDPNKLPPTEQVAYQHTRRSKYQALAWNNLDESALNPTDYGWQIVDGIHFPVLNPVACAPDELLNLIRCKCKGSCKNMSCSCKKHGLNCAVACQNCRGSCENTKVI